MEYFRNKKVSDGNKNTMKGGGGCGRDYEEGDKWPDNENEYMIHRDMYENET